MNGQSKESIICTCFCVSLGSNLNRTPHILMSAKALTPSNIFSPSSISSPSSQTQSNDYQSNFFPSLQIDSLRSHDSCHSHRMHKAPPEEKAP